MPQTSFCYVRCYLKPVGKVLGLGACFPRFLTLVFNWFKESGNSLYGERAKEKPFAARFASPDRHVPAFAPFITPTLV